MTLTLALPIAFQNLLSSSLSIVDNVMIGGLGDIAVAAVGEAAQVAFLINIFLFGNIKIFLKVFLVVINIS